ncbi:MAG TPA: hypothetical protein VEA58_10485, partial [Anaerovoracaceae bacterium]|nr:hypothetical protein [Anaerovoracaceae bacterium]
MIAVISISFDCLGQARSTEVVFTNSTAFVLQYNTANLGHGIWTVAPPQMIAPGATVRWKSESNGTGTGTEGIVNYRVMDPRTNTEIDGEVIIHWINPFIGGNDLKL